MSGLAPGTVRDLWAHARELVERAERDGFGVRIVRGPGAVQRVFAVSGLEPRLPFVDDPAVGDE
jgi:hypothetical protein